MAFCAQFIYWASIEHICRRDRSSELC
ncbi:uncharacterized protein METZ01_LOCUS116523 [marine metagenome]|uniref:Uncharacterized protein n=1 Tax=marine metagenome TaxID=408172 RepID=A0A381XG26_9ZZZZ